MKRTLALLVLFVTLSAFAGDKSFYGAWRTTYMPWPARKAKMAGEMQLTLLGFSDYYSGTFELRMKENKDATTVEEYVFTGSWRQPNYSESWAVFSGSYGTLRFNGRINLVNGQLTGRWVRRDSTGLIGAFQAVDRSNSSY